MTVGHPNTTGTVDNMAANTRHPTLTKLAHTAATAAANAPSRAAQRLIGRHYNKQRRAAATNPTWARIEHRRDTGGPTTVFLSNDRGLGLAEWATQRRIEQRLVPDPPWLPLALRVSRWHPNQITHKLVAYRQRARRGWSDDDTQDTARHLARVAAEMLEHLADTHTGWPRSATYPNAADWETALRDNAAALTAWACEHGHDDALNRWNRSATNPDADPNDTAELYKQLQELETRRTRDAQHAMTWIADNLPNLWD